MMFLKLAIVTIVDGAPFARCSLSFATGEQHCGHGQCDDYGMHSFFISAPPVNQFYGLNEPASALCPSRMGRALQRSGMFSGNDLGKQEVPSFKEGIAK